MFGDLENLSLKVHGVLNGLDPTATLLCAGIVLLSEALHPVFDRHLQRVRQCAADIWAGPHLCRTPGYRYRVLVDCLRISLLHFVDALLDQLVLQKLPSLGLDDGTSGDDGFPSKVRSVP